MPKSWMRRTSITMLRDTLAHGRHGGHAQLPTVERESSGELRDPLANPGRNLFRAHVAQNLGDHFRYLAHIGLAEAACGHRRGAEAHAARIHGWIGVKRDGVTICG